MSAADETDEAPPDATGSTRHDPLGAGSLAANVVAQAAMLLAALAHEEGDGGTAAQAQRIGMRAGVLSISNDAAFARATRQLLAAATGEGDGFWLEVALGEAAATPRVICETACDLAMLAASPRRHVQRRSPRRLRGHHAPLGGSGLRVCGARAHEPRHRR